MIVERPALERRVLESLDAGRIPVVLGGCAAGRTSLLLRLRALFGADRAQYIDMAAAATTPEQCAARIAASAPASLRAQAPPVDTSSARAAFDSLLAYFQRATADGHAPATFLLDEVQDVRTFESFPGLRHVQREFVHGLAASTNACVVTSRFTARAHRLLRDAPARFEVIHMPPMTAEDVHLLVRQVTDDAAWPADVVAHIAAASAGRAGYARLLVDALHAQPAHRRSVAEALTHVWRADGALTARCRESYEFRLHRARGYGALKAILGVLAESDGLTLTEISQRLHRTPGSTKDYLSWLEDVDLLVVSRKRYTFTDPLLRVFIRLHAQTAPPDDAAITAEVARFLTSLDVPLSVPSAPTPQHAPASAGIIEID